MIIPENWNHAVRLFRNGRLSGDYLVCYADQVAPTYSDEARRLAGWPIAQALEP
jgi:hypothetical protein